MNVGNINRVGFSEAEIVSAKKNNTKSLKKDEASIKSVKNDLPMVGLGNEKAASADSKICNKKINQRKSGKENPAIKKNIKEKVSSSAEGKPEKCDTEEQKKSKTRQAKAQKETLAKEINLLNPKGENSDDWKRENFAWRLLDVIDRRFLKYREKRGKVVLHMQEGIKIFKDLRASEKVVLETKSALIEAQKDYNARYDQLKQNAVALQRSFYDAMHKRSEEVANLSKALYHLHHLEQGVEEAKHLLEEKELEVMKSSATLNKEQGNLCEQAKKIKFQELRKEFNLSDESLKKAKDARDAAKSSLDFARARSSSNTANEGEIDIFAFDDFWDETPATVFGSYGDTSANSDFIVAQNNYDTAQQNYDKTYRHFNESKSALDKANQFLQPYIGSYQKAKFALENAQKSRDEARKAYEYKQNINKEKRPELDKALKEARDHYDKNFPILDKKFSDAEKTFRLAEKKCDEIKQKVNLAKKELSKCYKDYFYYERSKSRFSEKLKKDLLDMQKIIPNIVIKTKDIKDVLMQLSQAVVLAIDDKVFDKNLIKFLEIRKNSVCENDKKLCDEFNKSVEKLSKEGLKFSNEILNFVDVSPLLEKYLSSIVNGLKRMCNTFPLPLNARDENGVAIKVDDGSKAETMKDFIVGQINYYREQAKNARTEGFRQVCMSGPEKVVFANLFEPEIPNFYLSSEEIRQMGLNVEDVGK